MTIDLRRAAICILTNFGLVFLIMVFAWSNARQPMGAHLGEALGRAVTFVPYCVLFGLYLVGQNARPQIVTTLAASSALFFRKLRAIPVFERKFLTRAVSKSPLLSPLADPSSCRAGCTDASSFVPSKKFLTCSYFSMRTLSERHASGETDMRAVENVIEAASFAAFFAMVAFGFGLSGNLPLV